MLALTPVILALLPVVLSAPHQRARGPTITSFAGRFNCPAGLEPFHASTSITLPDVSAQQVWEELGDFCDVDWQGFEILSTKGSCNSQRSLRTYRAADLELTERLDLVSLPSASSSSRLSSYFSRSSRSSSPVYAHGYTMLNRPNIAGADVIRMKTLLKVAEGREGAVVSWDAVGCSDYPEHLADKLEEVHEGALLAIAAWNWVQQGGEAGPASSRHNDMIMMEQVMDAVMLA